MGRGTPLGVFIRKVVRRPDFIDRNACRRSLGRSLGRRSRSLGPRRTFTTERTEEHGERHGGGGPASRKVRHKGTFGVFLENVAETSGTDPAHVPDETAQFFDRG